MRSIVITMVCSLMLARCAWSQPPTRQPQLFEPPRPSTSRLPAPAENRPPNPRPGFHPLPSPNENGRNVPPNARPTAGRGGFPDLPPDPYADKKDPLPPLAEELYRFGGSSLYETPDEHHHWRTKTLGKFDHEKHLRLPEDWQEPKPLTGFREFLSTGPIQTFHQWFGDGHAWEPRFVAYGSYAVFGFALEQNNARQDVIGNQLLVDLDLRLTGTERLHAQFRPLGEGGSGGSYYQFSNPSGYVNNHTATPDRFWAELEVASVFGAYLDPVVPWDLHVTAGKFPVALHNTLLLNDDILGVAVNKNTLFWGGMSNINVQFIYGFNDVDTFAAGADAFLYAFHVSVDQAGRFWEGTYAFVQHDQDSTLNRHYAALSRTAFFGPYSMAMRVLSKWGDEGGSGSGQLYVVETNSIRKLDHKPLGIESAVTYCNGFLATNGWNSVAGGNFNRLQTPFEVNPLVRIALGIPVDDTYGIACGVQLFRHNQDESLAPEIAYEAPNGEPVIGIGFRYRRQLTARSFLEAFGAFTLSDDPLFDREGVSLTHTTIF